MTRHNSDHYVDPEDALWMFIDTIVVSEGFTLYDVMKPRPGLLRIFIDKKKEDSEKSGSGLSGSGVTADDCILVCRRLLDVFGVEGEALGIGSAPDLEVSSPGLDRSMRLEEHFRAGIGSNVKLWLQEQAVTGRLENFENNVVVFRESEKSGIYEIPFTEIRKAHRIF